MKIIKLLKLTRQLISSKHFKELKNRVFNNNSFYLFLTGGVFMMVTTSVVYYAEGVLHQNEQYKNLWDAFWWFWVTATTVGYGDKFPQSLLGQLTGIIVMLGGVVLVGIITGNIASFLVERQMKEGKGLGVLKKMENHFIICGWKREMSLFLKGILDANKDTDITQIVLVNNANSEEVENLRSEGNFRGIRYVAGDFIDERVLERASIKSASKILILADESTNASNQEIDSKTVMAVMTVESLNKRIYTCAELMDGKFERYLRFSNCNEIILSRDYNRTLIANASSASGLSNVVSKLLDVHSTTGLSTLPVPVSYIGKSFADLRQYYFEQDHTILVGILENTGNFYERKNEALRDAQKTADISKLIENLNSVKNLTANDPVLNPNDDYLIRKHAKAIIIERRKFEDA